MAQWVKGLAAKHAQLSSTPRTWYKENYPEVVLFDLQTHDLWTHMEKLIDAFLIKKYNLLIK